MQPSSKREISVNRVIVFAVSLIVVLSLRLRRIGRLRGIDNIGVGVLSSGLLFICAVVLQGF